MHVHQVRDKGSLAMASNPIFVRAPLETLARR
ncbi:hypothetical protein TRM7615_00966 [Falsiruegeria mediterranea M17]|jgi:hypothetical protein|uniref:Uncharacterized protein n=1 Tax=Falsiruegeria mediterranea M17 TaxID=1200281 RepID=A0A2R8C540_9RHOB|nr:hypothetical protein TRM7615_00966 [Falsiruegeria mediterranea M17]